MKVFEICFSPTGGTKNVLEALDSGLADEREFVDLTDGKMKFSDVSAGKDDVVVIAVPSYGGRVPYPAVERLAEIRGNGARAVLLCVYGNRAYEDTLAELQDTAKQAGFCIVAAVAAIAEHSIAREFAAGRPDGEDIEKLREFADKIKEKIGAGNSSEPEIPGNRPYKKRGGSGMVPKPTEECVQCGLCAKKCPVQAISLNDPKEVDGSKCISCMRCVYICPHSARKVNSDMLEGVRAMLKKVCSDRKEAELFI